MAKDESSFRYITYGARVSAEGVTILLEHAIDRLMSGEERPTPICIWGLHGIGKTELVRDVAKARGCSFVYLAPAQFEEMGDLVGMPQVVIGQDGTALTRFAPPEWVPRHPGPGILLLDDVNRADDRILRGIMQLFQNYGLVSWALPARWLIVCTANPDGGDYSVTTLDEAMLTRMLHVTMTFDAQVWARWAERNDVDPRGIHFVLTYPELVNEHRTTPRSLVQFFNSLRGIEDLRENIGLVNLLAEASLDTETAQAFISFVQLNMDKLPSPEDILMARSFERVSRRLERLVDEGHMKRMDVLSVIVTRLINYLLVREKPLSEEELGNLRAFISLPLLPNDLRLSIAQELAEANRPDLSQVFAEPQVAQLLLRKM